MKNITLSRVGELIRAMFELLWNRSEGMLARDLMAYVPEVITLTEYERGISPQSGLSKYERIIRVATIPLTQVGWLYKNNKGRWFITDQGRQACKRHASALDLYGEALRLYEERGQGKPEATVIYEMAQEKAWEQIQKFLQAAELTELLALVADLLKAMGYRILWTARPDSAHRQIGLVASVDQLGAHTNRILVQIKHKGQVFTLEGLKSALALLSSQDYGLLISTGGFTTEALDAIQTHEYQRLIVLDLEAFFDLWMSNHDKLSQEARNRLPIKSVNFFVPLD
jgi:restriction system protein